MLRRHEQDRSSPTSHVQNSLIAAKLQLVENFSPDDELSSKRGVQVCSKNRQDERNGQQ